jgi:hypothetical protein
MRRRSGATALHTRQSRIGRSGGRPVRRVGRARPWSVGLSHSCYRRRRSRDRNGDQATRRSRAPGMPDERNAYECDRAGGATTAAIDLTRLTARGPLWRRRQGDRCYLARSTRRRAIGLAQTGEPVGISASGRLRQRARAARKLLRTLACRSRPTPLRRRSSRKAGGRRGAQHPLSMIRLPSASGAGPRACWMRLVGRAVDGGVVGLGLSAERGGGGWRQWSPLFRMLSSLLKEARMSLGEPRRRGQARGCRLVEVAAWPLDAASGRSSMASGRALRAGLTGGVQLGEIERGLQVDLRVGEVVGGEAGGERAP